MAKTFNPIAPVAYNFSEVKSPALKSSSMRINDVPTTIRLIKPKPAVIPAQAEGIRVVKLEEYKQAAACLAEAFNEDLVVRYFVDVPDRDHWTEQEKWDLHAEILEYIVCAHILKGLVTTVGEFEAVALW